MSVIGGISLGMSILGGFGASRARKRRARKMKKAINSKMDFLKGQVPDIESYYNSLEDMLMKDTEVEQDRTIEDFTTNSLDFTTKSEKLVEGGKGLISGTVAKTIDVGKYFNLARTMSSLSQSELDTLKYVLNKSLYKKD